MHDVQLADWIGTLRPALKDAAKTANAWDLDLKASALRVLIAILINIVILAGALKQRN